MTANIALRLRKVGYLIGNSGILAHVNFIPNTWFVKLSPDSPLSAPIPSKEVENYHGDLYYSWIKAYGKDWWRSILSKWKWQPLR